MRVSPIDAYHRPTTIDECVELLRVNDGSMLLAGGQSALQQLKARRVAPDVLIDLAGVDDLRQRPRPPERTALGAMVRYRDILGDPAIGDTWPAITDAVSVIGDRQVRNRGTVGGNLAYADIATDMPTVFACLRATVVVVGGDGERRIPAAEFVTGDRTTALEPGHLVTAIELPSEGARVSAYLKYGITINGRPVIGVGVWLTVYDGACADASVVVGGVRGGPTRARAAEQRLQGSGLDTEDLRAAADDAADEVQTHDDLRGSAAYRRQLIRVYTMRALQRALSREGRGGSR